LADNIIKPLTTAERHAKILTCSDSAPGPGGISYAYYKQFWKFFGEVLTQSWEEGQLTQNLPYSHTKSVLRLLPKEGKDLTILTNWRPITLSNCDHKLITKCYARRLTNTLEKTIHSNQTAYLPGKQIQDNLRLINILNSNVRKVLIVTFDAKKVFDSVHHDYIRKTLEAYVMECFVPVLNFLYSNQEVDIAVNNDVVEGYKIKNELKQGDSLSCILFILSIDPLI